MAQQSENRVRLQDVGDARARVLPSLLRAFCLASTLCGLLATACVLNPQGEDPSGNDSAVPLSEAVPATATPTPMPVAAPAESATPGAGAVPPEIAARPVPPAKEPEPVEAGADAGAPRGDAEVERADVAPQDADAAGAD